MKKFGFKLRVLFRQIFLVLGALILLLTLSGCDQEEVEQADSSTNIQLFPELISGDGQYYCAGSAGLNLELNLIIINADKQSVDTDLKLEPAYEFPECSISKLTQSDLKNYSQAMAEENIPLSLSFRIPNLLKDRPVDLSVTGFVNTVSAEEEIIYEFKNLQERCPKYYINGARYQFIDIPIEKPCNPHNDGTLPDYNFYGMNVNKIDPAIVRCWNPMGIYSYGRCNLETWYKNHKVGMTFPADDLPIWQEIRSKIYKLLDNKVIAISNRHECLGSFCVNEK